MPAYRRLPSGLHQATVRTPSGRRLTRTDPLKGVVRAWAEETETAIRRGEWVDPRLGKLTLAEWWTQWSRARVIEQATRARDESHWRNHIKPRWGSTRLSAVTGWDVEGWAAQMNRDGVGATTRRHVLGLFRHMLRDAVRHRLLAADPTAGIKLPRPSQHVDRVLTHPEWAVLFKSADSADQRAQIGLMALAGLRWGEMAGLQPFRVNPLRRTLVVASVARPDGSMKPRPKSDAGVRVVPMSDDLTKLLVPLLAREDRLWTLDYSNWHRREWVPLLKRAKLAEPQPTPHDLRHSFGTWLAEGGMPPHEIMAIMGHSSITQTQRYLHAGSLDRARTIVPGTSTPKRRRLRP